MPDPRIDTLGVHVCLDLGGQTRLGPDYLPIDRVEDYSVDPSLGDVFYRDVSALLPFLEPEDLQPAMCGIRPKLAPHGPFSDFRILRHDGGHAGLIDLSGIDSPGLTSAPALAEIVAALVAGFDVEGVGP